MSATAEAANIIEDRVVRKRPQGYWNIGKEFGYIELGAGFFHHKIPQSWHLLCFMSYK